MSKKENLGAFFGTLPRPKKPGFPLQFARRAVEFRSNPLRRRALGDAVFAALLCAACESTLDDSPSDLPLYGAAPRSVQITALDSALAVQWTKVTTAQSVTPTYEVYYGSSPDASKAVKFSDVYSNDSNLVRVIIQPLVNRQTYYVWVKSLFEGLGSSGFSPVTSGRPVPPPQSPGPITVTPGEEMLDLAWPPAEDAFTYNVFYSAQGGGPEPPAETPLVSVSAPGAILPALTNGVSYTLWVQAENTAGKAPGYVTAAGAPVQAASAPASAPVIKTITPGNKKLTLTWDQVPGVPRYTLFYHTEDSSGAATRFPGVIAADSPVVTAELTGLANGVAYYVWAASTNSRGDSALSAPKRGAAAAKTPVDWNNAHFTLGTASAEYVFAQDLPPSVFFPNGRVYTDRITRVQESALGNLFTDAAAWYVREVLGEAVDFVFLNGSYIDNVLPQGTISLGTIAGVCGPDARYDKIVLLSLTGTQLKQFFGVTGGDTPLDGSVAAVTHMGRGGHDTGPFGMVSKEINYTIEYPKSPAGVFPALDQFQADKYWHGRIKAGTLTLNGAQIEDARAYRICTTDYNASGVYYTILNTGAFKRVLKQVLFYQAVAEYIYDKGTVTPKLDGRIQIEGGVPLPPPWKNSAWNPFGN